MARCRIFPLLFILFSLFSIWFLFEENNSKPAQKFLEDYFFRLGTQMKIKRLTEEEKDSFPLKIKGEVPAWFLEQINEDFSYLSNKNISEKDVAETFSQLKSKANFIHVKIINNEIYYKLSDIMQEGVEDKEIFGALKFISKYKKLPDVDFILSAWDMFGTDLKEFKAPVFVYAVNKNHRENRVMIPDRFTLKFWDGIYYSVLELNKEIPWEEKEFKAFWRGTTTCPFYDKNDFHNTYNVEVTPENYDKCPRIRLLEFSKANPDLLDSALVSYRQLTKEAENILKTKYPLVKLATRKEHLKYKIQINMDGNSCTFPGFKWRLLSNSLTLKEETDDIQWFYRLVKPYEHYVPFKQDMTDLAEKIEWVRQHDSEAKRIAERASKLVQENLKITDIVWYLLVLMEEYKKMQNFTPTVDDSFEKYEP